MLLEASYLQCTTDSSIRQAVPRLKQMSQVPAVFQSLSESFCKMDTSLNQTLLQQCPSVVTDCINKGTFVRYLVLVGSSYNERKSQCYHKTYVPAVHITREKVCK